MTTLANLIISARTLVGDGPTDNLVRTENVNNPDISNYINGSNKVFSVQNYPVTPGGTQLVVADNDATMAYTVNEASGQYTITTAPTATLYISYYFYLLPDSSWTEFITSANENVGNSTGDLENDISMTPEGLLAPIKWYACASFCMRLAAQTGLWYNQKLQEREEERENISKKYTQMAQEWKKQADAFLASYYQGNGTQLRPAMRIITFSPRPYTPSR
jgi:hypothetical protein